MNGTVASPSAAHCFRRLSWTHSARRAIPTQPIEDRHRNLAWATQAVYEDAFFHLLNSPAAPLSVNTAVALAGGCAYNSVANGKIKDRTAFSKCYLQSAAGDAGGAIGAAYAVWHRNGSRTPEMTHAFWGPSFTDAELAALLADHRAAIEAEECSVRRIDDEKELVETTARAIADGLVVGWFQGRMEWGPRALGNRSILGDPRRADMKNILNLKIKRRESFRPFAPSVLREAVADWFVRDDDVPFMLQVIPDPPGAPRADTGGHACRWDRTAANRRSRQQSRILRVDRSLLPADRRPDGSQHVIQRKRARRVPTGRSPGLLPPHQNGYLGLGKSLGAAQRDRLIKILLAFEPSLARLQTNALMVHHIRVRRRRRLSRRLRTISLRKINCGSCRQA